MSAPNYLHNLHLPKKINDASCGWLVTIAGAGLFLIAAWQWQPWLAILGFCLLLVIFFTFHLEWGMYLLAATSFFLGWQIIFSNYDWARHVPYLSGVNAPLTDFVAVFTMLALGLAWFLHIRSYRLHNLVSNLPGIAWYSAFLASGVIALFFIYDHEIGIGIKYLFRAMLFAYAAFVFLPNVLIHDRTTLDRVLRIWVGVGVCIAVFGLTSIFVVSHAGWVRFVPYSIFGFEPLGHNHNLLAEPLVVLLPIVGYFFFQAKDQIKRLLLGAGMCLMLGVALFTLSRAAWIALIVEAVAAVFFFRASVRVYCRQYAWRCLLPIAILLPIIAYMAIFLTSGIVASSTSSRTAAISVAAFYIARAPLIGYGPGTFQTILQNTSLYRQDFGTPLDSHGFIQKILLEEGVVGLTCFLGFLGFVLSVIYRAAMSDERHRGLYQALFIMTIGIIVFELFNTSYFNSVMWLPIGVSLAAVRLQTRHADSE